MIREEEKVANGQGVVGSVRSDPQKGTDSEGRMKMPGGQDKAREKCLFESVAAVNDQQTLSTLTKAGQSGGFERPC